MGRRALSPRRPPRVAGPVALEAADGPLPQDARRLPDAAWLRRQFTADADIVHDLRHAAVVLAALTALVFGLVPALQFSRARSGPMQERSASGPRSRTRQGLVMVEVALALTLLAGAGLLIRSFTKLTAVDPGFSPSGVVALQVFAYDRNPTADRVRAFFDATLERLASIPGVDAAGAVSAMPFAAANIDIRSPLEVIGRPPAVDGDDEGVYVTVATPGYFEAMSVPVIGGRGLAALDTPRGAPVAVISASLRQRRWPSEDPIGRRIAIQWHGQRVEAEIVGIVGHVRHDGLTAAARDEVFFPLAQLPFASMTYVLKGAGGAAALIGAAEREIWRVDPLQTFYETMSLERKVEASVVRQRFSVTVMAAFAVLALGLCASGIYGVISFTTAQRTREIGVRMALGADRPAIRRMVLREGSWTIGAGLAAGVAGALLAGRALQSLLFETSPGDPVTFAAVSALLAAVGLTACYLPARRATRIDPVSALRDG